MVSQKWRSDRFELGLVDRDSMACLPVRRGSFLLLRKFATNLNPYESLNPYSQPPSHHAIRFDPIFVLPVTPHVKSTDAPTAKPTVTTTTPGRRTGTGSAAISTPSNRPSVSRLPIQGFCEFSLLSILRATGHIPPFYGQNPAVGTDGLKARAKSLDEIRKDANRPIVVFPECTTSNGRGLLRFADVFLGQAVPTRKYNVFIMCVRSVSPLSTYNFRLDFFAQLFMFCSQIRSSHRTLAHTHALHLLFLTIQPPTASLLPHNIFQACIPIHSAPRTLRRPKLSHILGERGSRDWQWFWGTCRLGGPSQCGVCGAGDASGQVEEDDDGVGG